MTIARLKWPKVFILNTNMHGKVFVVAMRMEEEEEKNVAKLEHFYKSLSKRAFTLFRCIFGKNACTRRKCTWPFDVCASQTTYAKRIYFKTFHLVRKMVNIKLAPQNVDAIFALSRFFVNNLTQNALAPHMRTSFGWHLTCNIIYYCGLLLKLI